MAANAIVVTGDAELNAKLNNLQGSKAKAAIRKASRIALRPVADAAKANAPRRTGRLGRSIKVKAITRSRSSVGSRVTSSGEANQFAGKTYYGGFQEYGWKAGRRAKNADVGAAAGSRRTAGQKLAIAAKNSERKQIAATHFMKRAADAKKDVALQIYKTETIRWIDELSRKA